MCQNRVLPPNTFTVSVPKVPDQSSLKGMRRCLLSSRREIPE